MAAGYDRRPSRRIERDWRDAPNMFSAWEIRAEHEAKLRQPHTRDDDAIADAIADALWEQLRPERWLHPHHQTADLKISVRVEGTVDGQPGWFLEIDGASFEMDAKTLEFWVAK
jgi:hypothetical protein